MLVAWDGLNHRDAARVAGCTTATFSVRVHRARNRLLELTGDTSSSPRSYLPATEETP